MKYILFTNNVNKTHKMWSEKVGNSFKCYRKDNINDSFENSEDEDFEVLNHKEYTMWDNKKFLTKEDADLAIIKYVDLGIKAGIYMNKEVIE